MIDPDWRMALAAMDAAGDAAAALRLAQRAAFMNRDDADLGFDVGERFRKAGMIRNASAAYALVARMDDHHLRFRALLAGADCLVQLGEGDQAQALIGEAQSLDPGSHWPVVAMADLYAATGRDGLRLAFLDHHYEALRPDGKAELALYASGMKAYWHFERTRRMPGWRPQPPGPIAALARAGMILLVKDEADIIGQNLEHHRALGFRAFCILDNRSADHTRAVIERFRQQHTDCFVLLIDDPVRGHYQAAKMAIYADAFVRHAELDDRTLDWLFYIDADEFITPTTSDAASGFEACLTDRSARLLVFHWIHCASADLLARFGEDQDPFRIFRNSSSKLLPVVPKIACRVGSGLYPMEGNHFVREYRFEMADVRTMAIHDWYLWHFSLRSLEHVRKKVINGGRAFQAAKGLEDHGGHWRERYRLYETHGDDIIRQILVNHIENIQRLSTEGHHSPSIVDLDHPDAELRGITRILLEPAQSSERPPPAFVLGATVPGTENEYFRERNVGPVSIFTVREALLVGPYFEVGPLLFSREIAFSCPALSLDARWDRTRVVTRERLDRLARGEMSIRRIDAPCLLLATNGHDIFGHWLVDFLPKLFLLHKAGIDWRELRILMPSDIGNWAMELLKLFGVGPASVDVYDSHLEAIEARELVIPTMVRTGGRFSPIFSEALHYINDQLDGAPGEGDRVTRKIYFSRVHRSNWRILEDHGLVEAKAVARGYEIVIPEQLSIPEQVMLIRQCRILAGESGSALHSSMFNRAPMSVGVIHGNCPDWFAGLQSGIGEHNGHRTGYLFADTRREGDTYVMRPDPQAVDAFFDSLEAT